MKQILFFAIMISLAQFGCKKSGCLEPAPTSLNGKWRMIAVKDNASGLTTTKPVSIQNDVDITFTSINSAGELLQEILPLIRYGKMSIQPARIKH